MDLYDAEIQETPKEKSFVKTMNRIKNIIKVYYLLNDK